MLDIPPDIGGLYEGPAGGITPGSVSQFVKDLESGSLKAALNQLKPQSFTEVTLLGLFRSTIRAP